MEGKYMTDVLTTIAKFFEFITGVIASFFGFFGNLLPKKEEPET